MALRVSVEHGGDDDERRNATQHAQLLRDAHIRGPPQTAGEGRLRVRCGNNELGSETPEAIAGDPAAAGRLDRRRCALRHGTLVGPGVRRPSGPRFVPAPPDLGGRLRPVAWRRRSSGSSKAAGRRTGDEYLRALRFVGAASERRALAGRVTDHPSLSGSPTGPNAPQKPRRGTLWRRRYRARAATGVAARSDIGSRNPVEPGPQARAPFETAQATPRGRQKLDLDVASRELMLIGRSSLLGGALPSACGDLRLSIGARAGGGP
jgi:hypothetical protein